MSDITDFDFLIGSWRVRHRRLKERLVDNDDWIEFEGNCVSQKILGGAGNMDENFLDLPGDPYHAVAFRTYDPVKGQWLIWWIDGRYPEDLDPPVVGGFKDGVGTFYADHTFQESRFASDSYGRIFKSYRIGNRHFRMTKAERGKQTG